MTRKLFVLMAMMAVFSVTALAGPYTHFAYLNGAQEVPANPTTGVGYARCELVGNDLHYTIWFSGLTGPVTNGHFHTGNVGVAGGVAHPLQNLTNTGASGVWTGLTATQLATLEAHGFYVNIHTAAYPGGEIRGQVLVRGTKIAKLSGANEVPPTSSTTLGFGWFRLSSDQTSVSYAAAWSALSAGLTGAHIHRAPAGTNGPVVHPLQNLTATSASGTWSPLVPADVVTLEAEGFYVNIHSSNFPGGEIRSQLLCVCIPEDANFDALTDTGLSFCIALCPDQSSRIRVRNLADGQFPVVTKRLGCSNPCEVDCDPSTYIQEFFGGNWQYTNGVFWLEIRGDGCICVTLDQVLPVELNGFDAVAGDAEVTLNWTTASESELDRFEIERDGALLARVAAHNAASGAEYWWTDETASNGTTYRYTLSAVNMDGSREELASESATPQTGAAVISNYALHQNYPNPFNPETSIAFDLADAATVSLKVYNLSGQEVAALASGSYAAGRHVVSFDGSAFASGVYLYRLEANDFTAQQKMILLK